MLNQNRYNQLEFYAINPINRINFLVLISILLLVFLIEWSKDSAE